jgi:hypothetical protein
MCQDSHAGIAGTPIRTGPDSAVIGVAHQSDERVARTAPIPAFAPNGAAAFAAHLAQAPQRHPARPDRRVANLYPALPLKRIGAARRLSPMGLSPRKRNRLPPTLRATRPISARRPRSRSVADGRRACPTVFESKSV